MAGQPSELFVLLNGQQVGRVKRGEKGTISFTYDAAWRESEEAYPLSLSMPLARARHPDEVAHPFLDGLLPDNRNALERWGKHFHVSPRNPFALLTHMGEDCAGAVQLVRPDRLDQVLTSGEPTHGNVEWLSEAEVAARLRDAIEYHSMGRLAGDHGYFSLAGAQPKTALFYDGDRWGIPEGRLPTTHIVKPPAQRDLDGFAINEHFCLRLARELGLVTARSFVHDFDGLTAIVVERYDRHADRSGVVRLHQEDTCQALAVSPLTKYENEGGPGASEIVDLLRRRVDEPAEDVGTFVDALALNWVIGGTDAHAKNYSVLIRPDSVRLAPLYDLISALPYSTRLPYRQLKVAMRVDREYHIWKISRRHWEGLAERCHLDREPLVRRVAEVAADVPAAASAAATAVRGEGIQHDVLDRLEESITKHAADCLRELN